MTGQVEIVIDAVDGGYLDREEEWQGLRVRYRSVGTRRWSKFIVVGAPGQSFRDLLVAAIAVVQRCSERFNGRAVAGDVQLELGGATA